MKKKMIGLTAAVAVLACAVVALLLLRQEPPPAQSPTPAAPLLYILGGEAQPYVRSVEIQNQLDSFTIENTLPDAQGWQNPADPKHRIEGLDSDALNQVLTHMTLLDMAGLVAKNHIEGGGERLAQYGLESPAATVRVTYSDGAATAQFGDKTPGGEGYYALVDGQVYLVATSYVDGLLTSRLGFVAKNVTPGGSDAPLYRVVLEGEHFPAPLTVEQTRLNADTPLYYEGFRITSPEDFAADSSAISSLYSVFGLEAAEVVAIADSPENGAVGYGLDDPLLRLEVTSTTTQGSPADPFTVSFSAPDSSGSVYARTGLTDYIYRLSESQLPFLNLTPFDLRDKPAVAPSIDDVSQIEVQTPEGTIVFALTGEGDALAVTADGTSLDAQNFRQFYRTLIAARYDEEILPEDGESPVDGEIPKPVESEAPLEAEEETEPSAELLRITYRYRDGSPDDAVVFLPGPVRRARISLNGGEQYYTSSRYVDRVLADLSAVAAGEPVTAYR